MTNRTLAFATIAVFALGYGLTTRPPGLEEAGATPKSPISVGNEAEVSFEEGRTPAIAPQDPKRAAIAESHRVAGATESIDGLDPIMELDSSSDEPPIDLGEPMDAKDELIWDATLADEETIDIGPDLDVDDPLAWKSDEGSEAPVDLGEPLNAEDPEARELNAAVEEPIEFGADLDALAPTGHVVL